MIVIEKPQLKKNGDYVDVILNFEVEGIRDSLWFRFSTKYESFLVTENLDASLVALLLLGLKTGQDIKLNGPISSRLHYTINHYVINVLCIANKEFKHIKVYAETLNEENINSGKSAGTGLSCGVDSFAAYFSHANEKGAFKIEYLTFLNAGSHGDFGGEKARQVFKKRLKSVEEFAEKEDKEVISIDSNLSDILKLNFQQTNTFRSISCFLNLQKLFANYYYASSFPINQFSLNATDTSFYDILNLSMLSTESTNFFSSEILMTRIEKTNFISNYPKTYKYLDVCTNLSWDFQSKNCTSCGKCMRTALTLQLLGKLDYYKSVFDIEKYKLIKSDTLEKYLATKRENIFNQDLYQLLKEEKEIFLFNIPFININTSIDC